MPGFYLVYNDLEYRTSITLYDGTTYHFSSAFWPLPLALLPVAGFSLCPFTTGETVGISLSKRRVPYSASSPTFSGHLRQSGRIASSALPLFGC